MRFPGARDLVVIPVALALGCTHLPAPAIDPATCTYDRCGLYRAGSKVHRGTGGEVVASLDGMGPSLERFLVGNDSAIQLAREFRSLHIQARLARTVAAPAIIVAPFVVLIGAGGGTPPAAVVAALAGGAASLIFSFARAEQASRSIGRAFFLYNRDLPRVSPDTTRSGAVVPESPLRQWNRVRLRDSLRAPSR